MRENLTPEMIVNGASKIPGGSTFSDEDRQEIAVAVYRAMIASAPPQEGVREKIVFEIRTALQDQDGSVESAIQKAADAILGIGVAS